MYKKLCYMKMSYENDVSAKTLKYDNTSEEVSTNVTEHISVVYPFCELEDIRRSTVRVSEVIGSSTISSAATESHRCGLCLEGGESDSSWSSLLVV